MASADGGEDRQAAGGPNVILLVTDDQGYGDLSCHGNPVLETPHLDELHEGSARLNDFHVCPTCSPTRAAVMTGRHNLRTGVWHTVQGRSILARDEVTIADAFSAAGYRTGIFGKWHLGDNAPYRPGDRGFEAVYVHGGGGVAQTPDHWANDYFDDTYYRGRDRTPDPATGYCTDVWFDEAISFVEASARADQPFFCYLPTNAPHSPRQVPEEYRERYADRVPEAVARFYGMISNIDENVGRLRERLRELSIARETVLVFLGDNGSAAAHYNAGMRGAKGSQYDGGHRVPCFINQPGRVDAGDVDALSAGYDIFPTLVDLCGLSGPPDGLDGESLMPVLPGVEPDGSWPDRTLIVDSQRVERPRKWRNSAVMTPRWRLVDGEELYDIEEDPGQETDVSDEHEAVVARLKRSYEEWWADVSDRFGSTVDIPVAAEGRPTHLTAHDWHEPEAGVPWNHAHILEAPATNGHWTIEVPEAGPYAFELRRWPPESGTPIDGLPTDLREMNYGASDTWSASARTIDPVEARLEIAGEERTAAVPDGAEAVRFTVDVPAGSARLRTAFVEADGTTRGAYYVAVSDA